MTELESKLIDLEADVNLLPSMLDCLDLVRYDIDDARMGERDILPGINKLVAISRSLELFAANMQEDMEAVYAEVRKLTQERTEG